MLLYYVTDRKQFPGDETARRARLLETIASAVRAGADFIQLREKDLSARDLEGLARMTMERVAGTHAKLLINARADVAIAVGAHGVHLPSGDQELAADEARNIFVKAGIQNPVIAVSCHAVDDVTTAHARGADFAVFGPVFEKDGALNPLGLSDLRHACAVSRLPVLAIGGITAENAAQCVQTGAAGVAAIRLFQQDPARMEKAVAALRALRP